INPNTLRMSTILFFSLPEDLLRPLFRLLPSAKQEQLAGTIIHKNGNLFSAGPEQDRDHAAVSLTTRAAALAPLEHRQSFHQTNHSSRRHAWRIGTGVLCSRKFTETHEPSHQHQ